MSFDKAIGVFANPLCIEDRHNMRFVGDLRRKDSLYLTIEVHLCRNNTGPICKSEDEIKEFFDHNEFYFKK